MRPVMKALKYSDIVEAYCEVLPFNPSFNEGKVNFPNEIGNNKKYSFANLPTDLEYLCVLGDEIVMEDRYLKRIPWPVKSLILDTEKPYLIGDNVLPPQLERLMLRCENLTDLTLPKTITELFLISKSKLNLKFLPPNLKCLLLDTKLNPKPKEKYLPKTLEMLAVNEFDEESFLPELKTLCILDFKKLQKKLPDTIENLILTGNKGIIDTELLPKNLRRLKLVFEELEMKNNLLPNTLKILELKIDTFTSKNDKNKFNEMLKKITSLEELHVDENMYYNHFYRTKIYQTLDLYFLGIAIKNVTKLKMYQLPRDLKKLHINTIYQFRSPDFGEVGEYFRFEVNKNPAEEAYLYTSYRNNNRYVKPVCICW